MKKIILAIMMMSVLGSTACANAVTDTEENNKAQEEIVNQEKEDNTTKQEENKKEESADNKDMPEKEAVTIVVYYPNENADGTDTEEMKCEELTAEAVWTLLKEKDVVVEDTAVNSLEQEGNTLKLDVNEAFGNQLRSYGNTGETMLIQSVVNTFLDAYGCEKIKITENGETLFSGHMEYMEYMGKYE